MSSSKIQKPPQSLSRLLLSRYAVKVFLSLVSYISPFLSTVLLFKVSETEVFFEDSDFKFYSKPYFLRLNLPGEVVQDEACKVNYDSNSGYFNIVMSKKCPDQVFEGLDMISKLLQPRGNSKADKPNIEVLGKFPLQLTWILFN